MNFHQAPSPRLTFRRPPPPPQKRHTPISSASLSPGEGQNKNPPCRLHGPNLVQRPQVQPKRIVGMVRLLLAVDMRLGKNLWMVNLRGNWQAGRETSGRPKSLKQLQVRGARASAKIQKALSPGNAMASTSPLHTQPNGPSRIRMAESLWPCILHTQDNLVATREE